MPDSVETHGFPEAERSLLGLTGRLRGALVDATKDATRALVIDLQANTPVWVGPTPTRKGKPYPPGSLLRGWGRRVMETVNGAEGRVWNRVYYEGFVERGAHPYRPMRATPIVARGVALSTGTISGIYEAAVRRVVDETE